MNASPYLDKENIPPGNNCSRFSEPASSRTLLKSVNALVGINSYCSIGGKVFTASTNLVTKYVCVRVCRDVFPFTTIGKILVFKSFSLVLNVSVIVFNGGVFTPLKKVDEAKLTAGRVSILEDKPNPSSVCRPSGL